MSRRIHLIAFAIGLVPFCYLIWQFNFLCDDAFIPFRYSQNLANGVGLRYNLGVEPPVEGYTNFLWVIWLAVLAKVGLDITFWSRVTSVACAVGLLFAVSRFAVRRLNLDLPQACMVALFFGALPPAAVWSTSGMATLPFTLLVFLSFERLLGDRERPRGTQAGILLLLMSLTRADGFAWATLILGVAGATWLWKRGAVMIKATIVAGSIFAIGSAAHVAWRYSYYGAILPNTAYAKVGLSMLSVHRGFNYVVDFLLTYPSSAIVVMVGVIILLGNMRERILRPLVMCAGTCAYVVLVGGDWMCMSRFLVPAMPFFTLLFAETIWRIGRVHAAGKIAAVVLGLLCVVTNILPAFDRHIVPFTVRARFPYNGKVLPYMNPSDHWQFMVDNLRRWTHLGKALKLNSRPGESLVAGAIGAVGYYSELFIYDELGLVNREVAYRSVAVNVEGAAPPGHAKFVPPQFFLKYNPTYLQAALVSISSIDKLPDPLANAAAGSNYELVIMPLSSDAGFPEQTGLLLIRRRGDSSQATESKSAGD